MNDRRTIEHRPMTDKQRSLMAFCDRFLTQNDQLPTYQAITDHFGWASTNAAYEAMAALERRGVIERNALGRMRFTELGRLLLPDCYADRLDKGDERRVGADERYSA